MSLTARTRIKEIVREQGIDNVSADFFDRLDQKVEQIILDSIKRAKENTRKTVMGRDI